MIITGIQYTEISLKIQDNQLQILIKKNPTTLNLKSLCVNFTKKLATKKYSNHEHFSMSYDQFLS